MLPIYSASSRDHVTPSPPSGESSHDEFTPEHPSKSVASKFISPSTRSDTTSNLPSYVRTAINTLYKEIYCADPLRCLVTRSKLSLIISHAVQRASKPFMLSHDLSVVRSWLILPLVDTLRILPRIRISQFSCR
jgi:hypothetical protein